MKLRSRVILCIILTLAVLVPGVYGLSSRLLMQSYDRLERQDTEKNTERANRAFAILDDSIHEKSVDWASWDDTYQFMKDHNRAFVKANLIPDSIAPMKLDLILFVDNQGKVFHRFPLKRFPELPPPDSEQLSQDLHLDTPVSSHIGKAFSGIILHRNCPLLVSVRPVLNSKGKGPQHGWLVFGRYFDHRQLQKLAENTRLDIQTFRLDSPSLLIREQSVLKELSHGTSAAIHPKDNSTIEGYTQIFDVYHRPALLMKITLPRSIYQQGLASTTNLVRLIFLAGLILTGVILLVIEISVLSRLTRLTRQVEQIGTEGATTCRVVLSGKDELASLATQINGMLLKLEGTTETLQQSREQLRQQNENLEAIVSERTHDLMHQAFHDILTGLPNRAHVLYHLDQIARREKTGGKAVLFLDLDNFKYINDSLGHAAGDELLIEVARRLKTSVRPDDLVARLGGDEFLIILEEIENVEAVVQIAQRVLDVMAAGFSLTGGEGFTSTSIGIVYTEAAAIEPDILIRDADTAMYHAKSEGKAAFALFETGMNDRMTERVEMEVGLHLAVEQQEFCVHYQPLIDLKTGCLMGVEALVRWQHPEKGLIAPGKFIPVAEETGLIVPIGYWVMEEACRQALAWRQTYPAHDLFTINVNLSGKQLQKPDVVERVQEILTKTGLPPCYLKIEITESVMMADTAGAIDKLTRLRSLGVKLALDDFGTGYSSMASLSSFPLDTVKIDQAFISRLHTSSEASSVVAAIIMLAKSLHLDVTAEGIEKAEQVTSLQGLGCDIGQGYFFARPLQPQAMEERMTEANTTFIKHTMETDKELIERLLGLHDRLHLEELLKAA